MRTKTSKYFTHCNLMNTNFLTENCRIGDKMRFQPPSGMSAIINLMARDVRDGSYRLPATATLLERRPLR